jgi:hypothetical protein
VGVGDIELLPTASTPPEDIEVNEVDTPASETHIDITGTNTNEGNHSNDNDHPHLNGPLSSIQLQRGSSSEPTLYEETPS